MVRVRWRLKVRLMAAKAIRWRAGKYVAQVTLDAGYGLMRAEQRERRCAVIERRRLPGRRCVAIQAVMREIPAHVIGIGHLLKIILMA
jgi:hypothetical protein